MTDFQKPSGITSFDDTLRQVAGTQTRIRIADVPGGVVCELCWHVNFEKLPTVCSECGSAAPDQGFAPMPYTLLGRYRFVKLLGRGGMGAVFKAIDLHGDGSEALAVKVVQRIGGREYSERLREMFRHESAVATLLGRSPYFVNVLAHQLSTPAYLVMECISWPTLKKILKKGILSPIATARFGKSLLEAVEVMHFRRVVHCDLKPSNVFTEQKGNEFKVKIADLGIWTTDHDAKLPGTHQEKKSTMLFGSMNYMSPEQMSISPLGRRSDLHSVGSMLWECATGAVPFPVIAGDDQRSQLFGRRESVRTIPPRPEEMPQELYQIVCKALAYKSTDRFESAREMVAALDIFLENIQEKSGSREEMLGELLSVKSGVEKLLTNFESLRTKLTDLDSLSESISGFEHYLREEGSLDYYVFSEAMNQARETLEQIRATPGLTLVQSPAERRSGHRPTADEIEESTKPIPVSDAASNDASERYRISKLVGTGGMSRVFEAWHTALERRVVIKYLHRTESTGLSAEQQYNLFLAEARASASLEHPNIVRVYDFGIDHSGVPFCVNEYMDGVSLEQLLDHMKTLSESSIRILVCSIAAALEEAHRLDIVHRNLKPKRIYLSSQIAHCFLEELPLNIGPADYVKIGNFSATVSDLPRLIPKKLLFGTPRYMAPEQITGRGISSATDIYALGTLMVVALTGRSPYEEKDVRRLLWKKIHQDFPRLPTNIPRGSLSKELSTLIQDMLNREPARRPTAVAVRAALLR